MAKQKMTVVKSKATKQQAPPSAHVAKDSMASDAGRTIPKSGYDTTVGGRVIPRKSKG